MFDSLRRFILDPYPVRSIARTCIRRFRLGSYESRVRIGAVDRPNYGYCVYNAASLAKKLGYPRISVIEFGVAGGNGLISLEDHAREATRALGVEIDVYGFDTAEGLPAPVDFRDLPYHWKQGFYRMDVPKLRSRLRKAELVLGDVRSTCREFFEKYSPAPIGAISYDLDFYSSTAAALAMLTAGEQYYLPRVYCYFDDTVGSEVELYNDYTGQRLAINEFNENHTEMKLGRPYHLLSRKAVDTWYHQIWVCHFFGHSRYNQFVSDERQELPCN